MQKKLKSLFLFEPDTILKKAIAVSLVDLFEEIYIVENNEEAIEVTKRKSFAVYILGINKLDEEKIELIGGIRKANPNAMLITVKSEYTPEELVILNNFKINVLTEKPFSLNMISSEIEKYISRTNNEVKTK